MSLISNLLDGIGLGSEKGYTSSNRVTNKTLSFPSATNRGKNKLMINYDGMDNTNIFPKRAEESETFTSTYISKIPSLNVVMSKELKNALLFKSSTIETDKFGQFSTQNKLSSAVNDNLIENPWNMGGDLLRSMNWYRFKYRTQVRNIAGIEKRGDKAIVTYSEASITPSLFNPKFGVLSKGLTWNVPLLIDHTDPNYKVEDTSDCSIRNLVALSHAGKLGAQRYRYADFMYCKDLGKVANNHLITLRKFAFPVGDVIGEANAPDFAAAVAQEPGYMVGDDVARMITWFDTDDNKLEDILNFQYEYTWKQLNADRQDLDSQENDQSRGVVGLFANLNPDNYRHMQSGTSGPQNLWSKLLGGTFKSFNLENDASQSQRFRKYDNNKVYTPKQTVQDTYIPEGKLRFNQEINLTFSYKLRAYDNINPKSAFLDLLGNILECTYFRGKFWGGEQNIIGPKPNNASYYKVNAFLDNAWDKVGGVLASMAAGTDDFGSLLGVLSNIGGDALHFIQDGAKKIIGGAADGTDDSSSATQKVAKIMKGLWFEGGLGQISKAGAKNILGRPAFYAFDSLLSGEDTGLWHLTIGNPLNPIVSMGNMIMKNASIQHFGPLGIDDFPTEIKVKVTLAHARSRDLVQIGKMYTQGLTALYQTTNRHSWKDFYPEVTGVNLDSAREESRRANKASQESGSGAQSSDATDKVILSGNAYYSSLKNRLDVNPLVSGEYANADLSGSFNTALGQLARDEYAT